MKGVKGNELFDGLTTAESCFVPGQGGTRGNQQIITNRVENGEGWNTEKTRKMVKEKIKVRGRLAKSRC